jgi:energy-coupling factor transporter transmembrane protein EcfT
MPKAAAPIFPLRDVWLPLVPLLPLVLSAVLFSWLLDPLEQLVFLNFDPSHFVPRPQREYVHLGDMLSYFSLAAFHSLLCLAVVVTFAIWLRRLPRHQALGGVVFLGLGLLLVVAVSLFFQNQASEQVLTQLGYKAICQVIAAAELPTRLVLPGQCFHVDDISRLTLMAWVPTFSGMAAVCLAAAFAYANGRGLPPRSDDDPAWREAIAGRIKALQRSVYLLSAVLVSSTLTITLFAHLPTGLVADSKELALASALSKYASGLSTFWGALFSMTLIAAFAAPALRLLGAAYGAEKTAGDGGELQRWLHDNVFQSLRRQLATVLSLLAPLLVGPLSSLLSSVSGL